MIIKRYVLDWVFAIDVLLLRHYDTMTILYNTHRHTYDITPHTIHCATYTMYRMHTCICLTWLKQMRVR